MLTRERRVDLPTLGNPTSPTSAMTFSSSCTHSSPPACPGWAYLGTCMVEVAKCILPSPPLPPFRITSRVFSPDISAITFPVSKSLITVPSGTLITRSAPSAPWQRRLPPGCPSFATYLRTWRKSDRVFFPLSTWKIISPPLPPSPPSGPPLGT